MGKILLFGIVLLLPLSVVLFAQEGKSTRVDLPSSNNELFGDVDQCIKDSVLLKLQKDILEERQSPIRSRFAIDKNLRSQTSEIRFAPVVRIATFFERTQEGRDLFEKSEDVAFFYELENGKLLSLYSAEYRDNSNFTKDSNPEMYHGMVEVYGQEYADQFVEETRNIKGADRWKVGPYSQESAYFQLFEYALNQADDGKVIILMRKGVSKISYFKDNQFLHCSKSMPEDDIYIGNVEELVK